jgi:hypothetical protein
MLYANALQSEHTQQRCYPWLCSSWSPDDDLLVVKWLMHPPLLMTPSSASLSSRCTLPSTHLAMQTSISCNQYAQRRCGCW